MLDSVFSVEIHGELTRKVKRGGISWYKLCLLILGIYLSLLSLLECLEVEEGRERVALDSASFNRCFLSILRGQPDSFWHLRRDS